MRRLIVLLVVAVAPMLAQAQATRPTESPAANPRIGLARKLPDLKLTGVSLNDTVDFLRDVTGLNIHVNWRALELLNITRQTPVTLQLRNVSASMVLRTLINEIGQGNVTWYVEDGIVEITTRELADQKMFTKVYPVEDLVMIVPDFIGPTLNLQQQATVSGGGGGGGSSSGLISNSGAALQTGEAATTKQQRGDALVRLVTDTIRPEIWRENGGLAAIRYFNGHLIVTAPRSIHQSLGGSFR